MERESDADELRIEPGSTALQKRVDCHLCAAADREDIEMLRDGADAGQQRDLLPFDAVRIAAAVPVLVEAAHRLGGELAHTQLGDDAGASIAAKADHLPVVLVL